MAAKVLEVETITNPTTPTGIDLRLAPFESLLVTVKSGDINWTDWAGETITSSVGTLLKDGDQFEYRGDYVNLKFIAAAGTPVIRIHKYQRSLGW